jgi:hypothetical protein
MKQNNISIYIFTLTICVVAFLQSSCANRSTGSQPIDTTINWEEKTPNGILDQLRHEQKRISDFTAGFSILLDPPPKGQPSNLQGVLFYATDKKGPLVRIKSISAFGRVMFDLVQKHDTVQIYIPSRQTIYTGKVKKEKGNAWQEIFTSLFVDFSLLAVKQNEDLIVKKQSVILPLTEGTFHLDRKTGFVQKWVQKQRTIYYKDYISTLGNLPFPTRIFAKSSDNKNKTSCVFNQVQINKGLKNVFDLSDYHPKYKRNISELTQ